MPGNAWTAGAVRVTGGELAFHRTGGPGPPLVLSHGLTDNGLCWSRFAAAMAGEFDVIMIDARGHGGSSRLQPGAALDPPGDLAEAIAGLELEGPIVMGHSVGARATAAYANAHPGAACRVVLEDPVFLPLASSEAARARRDRFRGQVAGFHARSEGEILEAGRSTSPGWHDDDFPAWAKAKREVDAEALPDYATPWQREVDQISAPTLIVHGEARLGSLVTPAIAQEARSLNHNIETAEIAGAGHNVRRENFEDYLAVVRAFLSPCVRL